MLCIVGFSVDTISLFVLFLKTTIVTKMCLYQMTKTLRELVAEER